MELFAYIGPYIATAESLSPWTF